MELTIAAGALLGLIFTVMSYAMYFHAGNLVEAAARTGARAAATATPAAGEAAAAGYLAQVAPTLIENPGVTATTDGSTVTVTVDGTARTPLAGLRLHVHGHAVRPVETFRPDQ